MADKILCRCQSCGAEFPFNKHKASKFCGLACYRVAQRSGAYKRGHGPEFHRAPCAHCQRIVARKPSECRDGGASDKLFCDRSCYDAFRAALRQSRSRACNHCAKAFVADDGALYCGAPCWKAAKKAKPHNCVNCQCVFTPIKFMRSTGRFISVNGAKTCSQACEYAWWSNNRERKAKISTASTGERHHNWQGGKSLHTSSSNRGLNWQAQRRAALHRDRNQCVDCGMSNEASKARYGCGLHVDHVVPYHNFRSYKVANRLSNLECRCVSCHTKAESRRTMVQMTLQLRDSPRSGHRGKGRAHL